MTVILPLCFFLYPSLLTRLQRVDQCISGALDWIMVQSLNIRFDRNLLSGLTGRRTHMTLHITVQIKISVQRRHTKQFYKCGGPADWVVRKAPCTPNNLQNPTTALTQYYSTLYLNVSSCLSLNSVPAVSGSSEMVLCFFFLYHSFHRI